MKTTKKQRVTMLDRLERVGNKLPHPAVIFMILSGVLILLSGLFYWMGTEVTYMGINMANDGQVEEMTVAARNLLSRDGLAFILTSAVTNFTGFAPLGVVIAAMLGIGIADGSGLLTTALKGAVAKTPKPLMTAMIVFFGILSCLASDAGYVIVIPLAAILFLSVGRHPIAGLAAGFAGVAGGFGASLLLSPIDSIMAGLTQEAAQIMNPLYEVDVTANWYFGIASVFLLTILGAFITDKIVEPRLGKYEGATVIDTEEELSLRIITPEERRGLRFAGMTALCLVVLILALLLPYNGLLRGEPGTPITRSVFMSSLVVIISLFFALLGLAYGVGAKTIKNNKEAVGLMEKALGTMSGFIVLAFFSAQFLAYFNYTNLGTIVAVNGAELLIRWNLTGMPLILMFMVVVMITNFLMGSMTAKWAILAPVFVPMLMEIGFSPEFVQAAYRIADSTTNIVSPMMAYFALVVVFFQKYDKKAGIGTLVSTMLPFTIIFTIGWVILLFVFYLFNINIGPGVGAYL